MTTYSDPAMLDGAPPRPSSWPMAVGVIAIVFGAFGVIAGCFGIVMLSFLPAFLEMIAEVAGDAQASQMEALGEYRPMLMVLVGCGLLLSVMLVVGGLGLVRRRPYGVTWCLVWAVLKSIFVVANAGANYVMNQAQIAAMAEDPNIPPMPGGILEALGALGAAFGLLWGWALPVFMVIWFMRKPIRAEVRDWAAPPDELGA